MDLKSLAYYASPGRHTTLDEFPLTSSDARGAVKIAKGLLIDDTVVTSFYDIELSSVQADAIHERDSARLLAVAKTVDPRPIDHT